MNRKVDFSKLGGLYVYQDTLDFLQIAFSQALDGLAVSMGDKFVVSGMKIVGGVSVLDGFISVNGELLPFVGGVIQSHVLIETLVTQEQFADGGLKDTYTTKRAKYVAIPSVDTFPATELKRLPLLDTSIFDSLSKYHQVLKSIVNFEPEVILNGCEISNLDTMAETVDISAGTVMFDGQIKNVEAFSGSYPVYLTEAGLWDANEPATGLYITFDPHTSQRYIDVLTRANTKPGKIEMYETLSDRFVNGVGRWEMKGFELATSLQNRTPVGLWFDNVAVDNVTDDLNKVPGNPVGENKHQLLSAEQGSLTVASKLDDIGGGGATVIAQLRINGLELNIDAPSNQAGYGTNKVIPAAIAVDKHENRQPSRIVVYVKRQA